MVSFGLTGFLRRFHGSARFLPEIVAADSVSRLQILQLGSWLKVSVLNIPLGGAIATILYLTQGARLGNMWLRGSYASILLSYAVLAVVCWSWLRRPATSETVVPRMRRLLAVRVVLAACWAFGIVTMAVYADPVGRSVMLASSVAIMSMAVFNGPATFALSGWFPATLGAIGTAALLGTAPVVSMIVYAILTFLIILAFDRQMLERDRNLLRLERHAETIGILLRDFEESSSDWLWETDAALTLRHVSTRFAEVAQRSSGQMEINLFQLLAGPAGWGAEPVEESMRQLRQRVEARTPFRELVVPAVLGPERRWWALSGKPLFDSDGRFLGYRGVGADVTTEHRSRERIAYLARHDTLTDLANRSGFNDALIATLASCPERTCALFCLDLDEFKTINDTYGHDVGDAVLRAVGQRVRGALRPQDVAARLGGDEFAVVVHVADRHDAAATAQRVVGSLSAPFICGDVTIRIGVSVGVAVAPDDGEDPEVLYRNADLALYRAKSAGRGAWRMFDPNMDHMLHERRLLQRDLRDALPNGELFVAYQPIIDLTTRELTGLEALVRWRHPERGIVPPAEFVPIAEQSGQIAAIGSFVLAEAAALAVRLPSALRIAVNLSPLQLRDDGLVARVRDVLDRFAVPAERIEFEITESVMLDTGGRTLETLRELRNRGHRLAIDDFGTGYSSLAVLRGFPFDRLKIDRSFITDLDADGGDGPIVRAVIGLARALGISVTAEGVETERQASVLQTYRCASAQGFYFSRPLTPAQVVGLVAQARDPARVTRVTLPVAAEGPASEAARELAHARHQAVMAAGR